MKKTCILILMFVILLAGTAHAQKINMNSVRVTGAVIDADDREELPYVNIRIRGTRYGTSSDSNGYFSIFINPGDTLSFSSVGYMGAVFVMPFDSKGSQYSLLQLMRKETVLLDEIVVFPWPTLENFREAFMDARPKRNMDDLIFEVQRDVKKTADDNELYEYYYDQMRYNRLYELHREVPPNNFLNPIRWSNFVRDIAEGKLKKKKK